MSSQSNATWTKNSTINFVHAAIIVFCMFIFKLICPPFGPITEVGVGVLGVFIGIVYGWMTCGVVWPSILGIIAIGFTGFQNVTQAMQYGFGHNNVLTLMFVFPFMYAIEHAGIVKLIAYKLVNLKIGRGRPWVVSFLLIFAAAMISALVNPFIAIYFVWSLFYMVCDIYGIEKGTYSQYMIAGIAFGATMGCMLFTFAPPVMQPLGAYQEVSGTIVNAGSYSVFSFIMQVAYYLTYILIGKFILRIDLSGIKIRGIEGGEKVTGYQKIIIGFLVAFLVILFWPSFLPGEWTITQVFAALKGLSVFAHMMGPSLLTGSFFGKKEFGAILGVVQIFFAVGFAAGSSVFALLVDKAGYGVAWTAVLAYIGICYGALIIASIGMSKLNKKRISDLENANKAA